MILISVVLLFSIAVFVVAFFSPNKGTATQKRTMRVMDVFLKKVRTWPKFWRVVVTKPPIMSHKTIHHSAEAGKKLRGKTEDTAQRVVEKTK